MKEITSENIESLLSRFWNCYDGLVRSISVEYESDGYRSCAIVISTKDKEANEGWSNLVLKLVRVSELVIREQDSTIQVLSDGIMIKKFQDKIFILLSTITDEINDLNDIRSSDCYFSCEECYWSAEVYRD